MQHQTKKRNSHTNSGNSYYQFHQNLPGTQNDKLPQHYLERISASNPNDLSPDDGGRRWVGK